MVGFSQFWVFFNTCVPSRRRWMSSCLIAIVSYQVVNFLSRFPRFVTKLHTNVTSFELNNCFHTTKSKVRNECKLETGPSQFAKLRTTTTLLSCDLKGMCAQYKNVLNRKRIFDTASQRRRIEAAEMKLLRPLAGHTLNDHKTNDFIRRELQKACILDKID
jgi:hypothetical protein